MQRSRIAGPSHLRMQRPASICRRPANGRPQRRASTDVTASCRPAWLVSAPYFCLVAAFPSSSLVYIANLALLTTTLNRPVPCPNAVRLTRARLLTHARAHARRTTRAPRLPLLRPSPCRRVRESPAALARVFSGRLQPALSRESPARIARGHRSPTAFTTAPGSN
jgi:hypothetical protein